MTILEPPRRRIRRSAVDTDDDPEVVGRRFLATAYRTTRAILSCRRLLVVGRSLQEAIDDDRTILQRRLQVDPTSILGAMDNSQVPTAPDDRHVEGVAGLHLYAAIQLGIDPNEPCLHWFLAEHILEFFPSEDALIRFEAEMLSTVGKAMLSGGRTAAATRMEGIFGKPSAYERRDWAALPMAYVRDYASVNSEDDRTLMVARLEKVMSRARLALDLRTELAALRQIATVQGLTFLDTDKAQKELLLLLSQPHERSEERARLQPPKDAS